jgi:hypothetical protein
MIRISKITFVLSKSSVKAVTDRAVNAGLNRAAGVAVRAIKQSFSKNGKFRPSAPGSPPNRNSSLLFNSISATKAVDRVLYVYSGGVVYARKHEQPPGTSGRVVMRDRRLTIPLNPEAARLRERTRSLYFLPLIFRKTKSGRAILFDGRAGKVKGRNLRPMFMLVASVNLPPRPFMRPAFSNPSVRADMTKAFCQGSKMALQGTLT